jgi:RHS repeat-associated protein
MKRTVLASAALLLAVSAGAQETAYEKDAQGRIAAVTTPEGTTRYTYFPDGLIESVQHPDATRETYRHEELVTAAQPAVSSQTAASQNRFLFTGYLWDAETGLYYAKARYYDPKVGRFITQDSYLGELTDPPSLHRYLYAHDNPTRFIDPTGHSDADANRLAAAMHKRTGFLASDHRPAHERGWWYNFGRELYVDLPPRLIPMGQLEGLANQYGGQFAKGTTEIVVAAVLPPAVKKGAQALVARYPVLGKSVTDAARQALQRPRARPATAEAPAPPIETSSFADAALSDRAFMPTGDGRMAPLHRRIAGGSQGADAGLAPSSETALTAYDPEFAAQQLLGRPPITPGGRQIYVHAAERMTNPPAGRAAMAVEEVDLVLDTATKVRKITPHKEGITVTVQRPDLPGKPQVVVDSETGKRVLNVIKQDE